ncbi:MAG: histidine ammonia-lyase [marine bacterium B5-7]|nr:MAG: histidine ammonia-lyase [marine bacterium B5-7]
MNPTLILEPGIVSLHQLENIYRSHCAFEIHPSARPGVEQAAHQVAKAALGEVAVYGVNTGFGKLASTRIAPNETATLQRNLILSHCCGVGKPLPLPIVRLVIALKIISLGRGASGVRWEVIELLQQAVSNNILPVMPEKGSVGASGDLAPLAHLAAMLIGEGEVFHNNQRTNVKDAFSAAGLKVIELGPKEGLGLINGTQVSTALAMAALFDGWRLTVSSLVSGAMAIDAMMASTAPFHPRIHELRGHQGQIDAAATLNALLDGSGIRASHLDGDQRVQDPYCLRCQPQVVGACIDLWRQAARTLRIEANAVTDNPLVIGEEAIISGGNFHAEPIAFVADICALAIAETGSISQRRIATMVDPTLNHGLPPFLTPNPGLNSGMMIAEVTTAALMSENKQRATPCSVDSTPTSASQEDHVSMACHGARRLLDMNENLSTIVGVEVMAAAQGIGFRQPLATSPSLDNVIHAFRLEVASLENDRYLANDIAASSEFVSGGKLLAAIDPTILPAVSVYE